MYDQEEELVNIKPCGTYRNRWDLNIQNHVFRSTEVKDNDKEQAR